MSWFSNLFKNKEKETQPIVSPKIQTSTVYQPSEVEGGKDVELRTKTSINRDFQGKFITGNPYNLPQDPKTGRFVKK